MDLILWRHADAEDGSDDLLRCLTPKGRKQAERMGAWLDERLSKDVRLIASQALRAQETAEGLSEHFKIDLRLNPDVPAANYLAVADWPHAGGQVVLVGHQPTIGRVASRLLTGLEADWSVKKGSIWWLQSRLRDGERQTVLKLLMTPDQL
ncbi:SixA phosphatase family protein [Parachitinimonas caeni]|uniref:Histidine phosphatase family protein n=1 Tax=Parachitinimonas caeni TaxID=3031301 RepID=A0ABT7DVK5_9NEIS|nr:histidine phosphatase family protein [Parachitinimonas caeni]MDK2124098.1 histidine phosphatase family protein [Parachitinimonas caeni]